jgi:hypothetical protein
VQISWEDDAGLHLPIGDAEHEVSADRLFAMLAKEVTRSPWVATLCEVTDYLNPDGTWRGASVLTLGEVQIPVERAADLLGEDPWAALAESCAINNVSWPAQAARPLVNRPGPASEVSQ